MLNPGKTILWKKYWFIRGNTTPDNNLVTTLHELLSLYVHFTAGKNVKHAHIICLSTFATVSEKQVIIIGDGSKLVSCSVLRTFLWYVGSDLLLTLPFVPNTEAVITDCSFAYVLWFRNMTKITVCLNGNNFV